MKNSSQKMIAVLLNPSAGSGRAQAARRLLEKALRHQGVVYELIVTESEDHLRRLIREAAKCFPALAIAGGDSSIFITINEMINYGVDIPLGIIGLGSCNDLSREFGIFNLQQACRAVRQMNPRRMDLGMLTAGDKTIAYFPGQASLGLGVEVNRRIEEYRKHTSFLKRRQFLSGAWAARQALRSSSLPLHLTIETESQRIDGEYTLALFSNIRYYASGLKAIPQARPADGRLDALLLPPMPFFQLFAMGLRAWLGRQPSLRLARHLQSRHFRISSPTPFAVQVDGEILKQSGCPILFKEISIQTLPAALSILA